MKIRQITLYWVKSRLTAPYRPSYRTFEAFEPILVDAIDEDRGIERATLADFTVTSERRGNPSAAVRAAEQHASETGPLAA